MPRLEFDPNTKEPPVIEWATYIPGRTTENEFKVHKRRGDALSAFTYGRTGILYRWQDGKPRSDGDVAEQGKWVEVFRIEDYRPPQHCESCGKDMEHVYPNRIYNEANLRWVDVDTSPRAVSICNDCSRHKHRTGKLP